MAVHRLPRSVDTAIIGAGQAGLSMSWFLSRAGREHVILEKRELLGGGWRDRWDEFCLVTPNWSSSLPGYPYDGRDPDGFMPRDEIAARIARYASAIDAPVHTGAAVDRLSLNRDDTFRLDSQAGPLTARRVVVATGGFHQPKIPAVAAALPDRVTQVHSHEYRSDASLPAGAVLVVGSGQTGAQLAEELHAAGRSVYLSVGSAGRIPRRYRGRDVVWWLTQLASRGAQIGVPFPTVKTLPDPRMRFAPNPHMSGHNGGHDTNLRGMAADGITLLGHLESADGEVIRLAPDLASNLTRADGFFDARFRHPIDTFIERTGVHAPPDNRRAIEFDPPQLLELDLARAGITTVLWSSGYKLDYRWLDLPILDEYGMPRQDRGVSDVPGLYFLGLPWMHNLFSAALPGIPADARHLARRMGLVTA